MKVYMMTDMEGVAGVVNSSDWCRPEGRYYERGKALLTAECNAAIGGLFQAGATEILVVDGHGCGGVDHPALDRRASYARVFGYPFCLDSSFDCIVHVGQHAKAGTPYAHLSHTGSFGVRDCVVNGISVGEFGEMALLGASLGIPVIFASGDEAFAREAEALCPGVYTAAVKRGTTPGGGDECTAEAYAVRNLSAVHMHPETARDRIAEKARAAMESFSADRNRFPTARISPPYRMERWYRVNGGNPAYRTVREHSGDYLSMLTAREQRAD